MSRRYDLRARSRSTPQNSANNAPGRVRKPRRARKPVAATTSTTTRTTEKPTPMATTTTTTTSRPASPPSIPDTRLLYEKPKKWTQEHLRIANIQQESDVPIDRIVDAQYIPSDEDTALRRLVDNFQNPSVEDSDPFGVPIQFDRRYKFFTNLSRFKWCGRIVLASSDSGLDVLDDVLSELYPDQSLTNVSHSF